jgi:hypothetical protein
VVAADLADSVVAVLAAVERAEAGEICWDGVKFNGTDGTKIG